MKRRLTLLEKENRLVEAQRLEQRTMFDLEMISELGYCNGIENYSRHLTGARPGEPPPTLFASGLKVKGRWAVDLTWTGTVKPVDLYRDGVLIAAAVPSDPASYRDLTGEKAKGISFTYEACIAGTDNCSEPVTVSF